MQAYLKECRVSSFFNLFSFSYNTRAGYGYIANHSTIYQCASRNSRRFACSLVLFDFCISTYHSLLYNKAGCHMCVFQYRRIPPHMGIT